jgi:hypothetical protein
METSALLPHQLVYGKRVRLVSTTDRYTKLRPGAEGVVTARVVDPWRAVALCVSWDDGSSLSLLEGEDAWEILN